MNLRPADPDRHELPTRSELNCLRPGLFVRLRSESGEAFWARVTSGKRGNHTWTGEVETKCATDADYGHRGALVVFGAEHVLEVI